MSIMDKNEKGLPTFLAPFVISVVLAAGLLIFGIWAFSSRQDYKNKTDQKIDAAIVLAKRQTQATDAEQYAQEAQSPYTTYVGPQAFGTLTLKYPKTWSAYVVEQDDGATPINGYFDPAFVPDISNPNSVYALRVEVTNQSYTQAVSQFTGLQTAGKATVAPFSLSSLPSIVGVKVTGEIASNQTGIMVLLPLRTETIELWTETTQYESEFNAILSNFTFSP